MKSLSYTNNMQSLEKLLLMISTEGLMAHKCLAPAAAGIIWEENNTTQISEFLGVSLLLFRFSHSSQCQAGCANTRLKGNWTAFEIKAFKIHTTQRKDWCKNDTILA